MLHPNPHPTNPVVAPAVHRLYVDVRATSESVPARSGMAYLVVALASLSAGFYFHVLIIIEVILDILYSTEYDKEIPMRLWDGFFVGQLIGQILFGILYDYTGQKVASCASVAMVLVGSVVFTAACGVYGSTEGLLWVAKVAQGITGAGIGGINTVASTIAAEVLSNSTINRGRAFVLINNGVFSAASPLVTVILLIALSAAQPGRLETVWPACVGVGIIIPLAALFFATYWIMPSLHNGVTMRDRPAYFAEFKQHWIAMARTSSLWFVYAFIAYPKIVFSEAIIFRVVNGNLWRTVGLELLLSLITFGGSLAGAFLCDSFGRRKTILLALNGFVLAALITGSAYDRLTNIVPLLVIFYALTLFMGNIGPGNLLSLVTADVRASFYGITAAFGTAGAISGIHAFKTIDENLGTQWAFIVAGICGIVGVFLAYLLPQDVMPTSIPEKSEKDQLPVLRSAIQEPAPSPPPPNRQENVARAPTDIQVVQAGTGRARDQSPTIIDINDPVQRKYKLVLASDPQTPRDRSRSPQGSRKPTSDMRGPRRETSPSAHGSRNAHGPRNVHGPPHDLPPAGGPHRMPSSSNVRTVEQDPDVTLTRRPRAVTTYVRPLSTAPPKPETPHGDAPKQRVERAVLVRSEEAIHIDQPLRIPGVPSSSDPAPQPEGPPSTGNVPQVASPPTLPEPQADTRSRVSSRASPTKRISPSPSQSLTVEESVGAIAPERPLTDKAPDAHEAQEVITQYVAETGLQKFFQEGDAFVQAVVENAAKLEDDGESFPVTRDNVERLIRLSLYHPVIYCDDSGSMQLDTPSRWDLQRDAVRRIAGITTRAVPQQYGVSLRFINTQTANKNNIPAADVLTAIQVVRPSGGTALGRNLQKSILNPLVHSPLRNGELLERPLLICVITDGSPSSTDNPTFEEAIKECRQCLVNAGYEPTAVRFCLNQIGGDESSARFLESLRRNTDIQDVVFCTTERLDVKFKEFKENGKLLDEWLLRMLSEPIMFRAKEQT
ncbi:hypothetical protein EVJ58_g2090 [Rhodofomes roseus]|uniref:Major facilitator superfamily (MFS) profile domain-containing protein n=1 Tax=Rhodofomes roseus TaxID=34475 RepID=A0A4Y9YRR1_9APHY|nr:hypothetical protein EVJ58_g2090 [Rhodofomes roseus]